MELSDDERDEDEFEPGIEEDVEEEEDDARGSYDTDTETDREDQERCCPLWTSGST